MRTCEVDAKTYPTDLACRTVGNLLVRASAKNCEYRTVVRDVPNPLFAGGRTSTIPAFSLLQETYKTRITRRTKSTLPPKSHLDACFVPLLAHRTTCAQRRQRAIIEGDGRQAKASDFAATAVSSGD